MPSMPPTSLAVASSPSLVQSAMSPAATITSPEGGPGSHSGAQPTARIPPRRATGTIGANLFLLALGSAPSMSEATAEPAATILTNFETAISLLITGREDAPRASPPRRRCLHTRDGLARCAVVRSLCRRLPAGSAAKLRIDDRLTRYPSRGATPQSALHIITGRSAVNLQRCKKGYSPKCVEGKFSEVRTAPALCGAVFLCKGQGDVLTHT